MTSLTIDSDSLKNQSLDPISLVNEKDSRHLIGRSMEVTEGGLIVRGIISEISLVGGTKVHIHLDSLLLQQYSSSGTKNNSWYSTRESSRVYTIGLAESFVRPDHDGSITIAAKQEGWRGIIFADT